MTEPVTHSVFLDRSGATPEPLALWEPIVISRAMIDAEIARLADEPMPADGRRRALIRHPSNARSTGLAPGIQVALDVLRPGERTTPLRQNATQIGFVIRGSGEVRAGGRRFEVRLHDVWNTPSMQAESAANTGDDVFVRLTYSNAALLEMLNVHVVETAAEADDAALEPHVADDAGSRTNPFGTFPLTDAGAWLMPYETLINPPAVESPALHWPWEAVRGHLDKLVALGRSYVGRRLYLLYNPMTGRTNGTTPNFFATMTIRPPGIVDRPHRHVSAAINYYFEGSGRSTVEGKTYEWGPGDLMLSAPGWAVHNHASYDAPVYELTVQDQPLNIAMESLLWQESLKAPPAVLGVQAGFATNRAAA